MFLLMLNVLFLVLGCFLDAATIILVILPVFIPTVKALGIDLVHFGIVAVVNCMIGLITPPYGVVLFVLNAITGIPLKTIIESIWPWLIVLIAMPTLASLHAGTTDPALRLILEVNYTALNGYAGSVGELLGVQLFSGFWLVLLGVSLSRMGWRLNGLASLALGIGFVLNSLRTLAPELGLLSAILPPLGLAWLLMLAGTIWRKG